LITGRISFVFDKLFGIGIHVIEEVGEFCIREQVFLHQTDQIREAPRSGQLFFHHHNEQHGYERAPDLYLNSILIIPIKVL